MAANAVVRIQDVQFRVEKDSVVRVPKLASDVGETLTFDEVLLIGGDSPVVGTPLVEGASVKAEVLEHGRDDKIVVFKKKRRKGYRKTLGHRQDYTEIRITGISG